MAAQVAAPPTAATNPIVPLPETLVSISNNSPYINHSAMTAGDDKHSLQNGTSSDRTLPQHHPTSTAHNTRTAASDKSPLSSLTPPIIADWVLWEHKASGQNKNPNQWKDNMSELCHFSTVEDFWSNFNHIPKPSQVFFDGETRKKVGPEMKTIEEYSLFKKGIEPEWGDPKNATGGEWFCRQHFDGDVLDRFWQNLVLGVVGETIEDQIGSALGSDCVNGVRVLDKSRGYPMYKVEIWVSTRDPAIKEKLKESLLQVMMDGLPSSAKIQPKFEWKDHSA